MRACSRPGRPRARRCGRRCCACWLHLAGKYGHRIEDATEIELAITQQELADMVGASRVMVANVLKDLYEDGVVRRRDGRYAVCVKDCM